MITLKIDKTVFQKKELEHYLDNVKKKISEGIKIGEDWDIEGEEENDPDNT